MKGFAYIRSLAAKFFHRPRVADEMEQEVRSHIELRAEDLERTGLSRPQAERRARMEFGTPEKFKEECHEAMGGHFFDILVQDLRLAFRMLSKSPGFALIAVLTLALAIGTNAIVFGVMDALVLRPLNVPQGESLWGTQYGVDTGFQSYPNYVDLRDRNRSFEDLAAFNFAFVGLDTGKEAFQANGYAATGNFFDVLKLQPLLGRFFHASDERGPNSAPYLVL
ncbi:MAG: permease prefix domain 1-containing protein, partial [Candidatus Sulfotelmatobacter sp.]